MTRKYRPSRFHPCATIFADGHCGGIASFFNNYYTCNRCESHWTKQGHPIPRRCTIEGCNLPHRARGLCNKHYIAERNTNV